MVPKFRAWYTPFKGKKFGQEMIHGRAGSLISHAEMSPDNYVLMQSTGLKDKNSVEVFQGDIVRCTRGCPHEVVWLQEYAGMYVGGMPAWYLSGLSEGYARTGEEEIIGNIYENPELLEKANEN